MKRREFLQGAAAGAALAGHGRLRGAEARPNVLILLVDQWREPVWTPHLQTPNLDRLAARGVSFTNHFVAASPCSPSRACLLTGTHTTQNQMFSNCDFVEGQLQPSLDPSIPTLGHAFQQAGYRTPYRGKWHLTRRADRNPRDNLMDYGFEGWKPPEAYFGGPPYCGKAFDPLYARRAMDWLQHPDSKKQPWLMVASLVNPHDICAYPRYVPQQKLKEIRADAPPPNWNDDLAGKPRVQREFQEKYRAVGGPMDLDSPEAWRRYLDYYVYCMEDADKNIGLILDTLEKTGQSDNTIILFTSDHGEMAGSHRLRTKGNFAYEEVMRVPLLISWPGRLPEGERSPALASSVDVAPTLCALAGVPRLASFAGVDLGPALRAPRSGQVRDHVLFHQDWECLFTVGKGPEDVALYENPSHIRALRDGEWKYAYYFSPGRDQVEHELYNLRDDPLEMVNLASDPGYQARRREMSDRLREEERKLAEAWERLRT
jgi:arylsulfatase